MNLHTCSPSHVENNNVKNRLSRTPALLASCLAALALLCGTATAADVTPPAAAFARLPAISMVRLAPDGKTLAYASFKDDRQVVLILDLEKRRYLRQIVPDDKLTLRDLDWADNGTLLVTLSKSKTMWGMAPGRRSIEWFRVFAFDAAGDGPGRVLLMNDSQRQAVTGAAVLSMHGNRPGTVVMSSWDYLSTAHRESTGSRIAGGRKDEGWVHALFEVDTATGKAVDRIAAGTPFTEDWIVDAHGQPVARTEWNPDRREYQILANGGGNWRVIFTADNDRDFYPVCLDADGKALVALGTRGDDTKGAAHVKAWRVPLDGSAISLLYQGDQDVENVIQDRFSGAPARFDLGGLEPTSHWLDPKMQRIDESLHKAFANSLVTVFNRSEDYGRVLARVERSASPPVYYLVDLKKGTADTVGEMYPELQGIVLGTRQATHYQARDRVTIPAYLTLPPGVAARNLPLLVLPHGGPWARDEQGFDWLAEFLATRGYAVLQPQFRGSVGFGASLEKKGTREWGRAMQDDITDGVEHLIKEGIADKRKVCIVGGSYGGYAALAGAAFTPDLYACAVSINGVSDLPRMMGWLRQKYGDESDALQAWTDLVGAPYDGSLAASSPSSAVAAIRAPILLVHGTDDSVVPYGQSAWFAKLLEDNSKSYQFIKLAGEDHWLSTARTRLEALQAIGDFLAKYLGGKPAG